MPFTEDVKGAFKAPLCCIIFMVVLQICLRTSTFESTLLSLPAKDTIKVF